MAYDEGLAQRIREILGDDTAVTEKKMFGGLAFMSPDYMFVGIIGDKLMVRCGPEQYNSCLSRQYVSEMDFTGRPMKGYIYVSPAGIEEDKELEYWIKTGRDYAASLPPKAKGSRK